MMVARRHRHLIRLLGMVLLGAFLLGTLPCTLAHADDHEEAEAACVCVCCHAPLVIDEPAATRDTPREIVLPVLSPGSALAARDLIFAIFQPPKV